MSSGQGPTNSGGLTDDKRKLQEKGQTQKSVEKLQKEKKPSEQNLSRQLSFPKTEKPEKVTAAKPTPLKRRSSDSSATSPCEPVDTETIRGAICKELQEKFQVDPLVCIAFAGADGAGKTSLIRSLTATSGVKPFHSKVITLADVYPAPMLDPCCFIYDLVGGKTSDAHTNRYVRNLTAFNAVVIVLGNRITEIDRTIAEFCQKNNINCVFVRSKSDVDLMSLTEERGLDLDEAKTVLRNTVTDDFVRWASTLKTSNKMQKMVMLVNYKYWQDPKEYAKYEMHEKIFWEHLKRIAKYRETHF